MKGKKITALVLSLAMVVGVPAAVLADEPDEAEGSEQAIVEEVPEETEVTVNSGSIVVSPMAYCLQFISSEKTSDGLKALVVYNYQAVDVYACKGLMWDLGLWSGFPIFQQKSSNYRKGAKQRRGGESFLF